VFAYLVQQGHSVRIVPLLATITKSLYYGIHINWTEDMQRKLKSVINDLKTFVALALEVSHAPIVTMISVINRKIHTLL